MCNGIYVAVALLILPAIKRHAVPPSRGSLFLSDTALRAATNGRVEVPGAAV